MDRQKNNLNYKKDFPGAKNKTDKTNAFAKATTSISAAKKPSLSMSTNSYHKSYERPKPTENTYKKEQNFVKVWPSVPTTSYNNSKQQNETSKTVQTKQDRTQTGVPHKADNKSWSSSSGNKEAQQFDVGVSKFKQQDVRKESSTKAISTSSSRVSCESKTFNPLKDNKSKGTQNNDKFIADYVANVSLVRTMKHMWAGPKKGKDVNPMKSTSYVTSGPKQKYKPEELVNSKPATHFFWEEPTTSKATKSNVPENFLPGPSKIDGKLEEKVAEAAGTDTSKSFEDARHGDVKEEELQSYLLEEPALTALYIGLPPNLIKQAIKEKLRQTGTAFTSTRELRESVLNLQKEAQVVSQKSLEVSTSKLEEGTFPDRKMLEEIEMLKQEKLCKICLDGQVGIVFVPCGHLVACVKCSKNVKVCPLCRVEIQSTVKTFLS